MAVYDAALTATQVAQHWAACGVGATDLVQYTIAENTATVSRTGSITIAGETVTVTQDAAPCTYQLSTTTPWAGYWGAIASFTVTTSSNCDWTTALPSVPSGNLQTSSSTAYRDGILADAPVGYWRRNEVRRRHSEFLIPNS